MKIKSITICLLSSLLMACHNSENNNTTETPKSSVTQLSYTLVQTYKHDTNAFTEGLLMHNNELYESTGATSDFPQTRSLFGTVNLETGKIAIKAEIDKHTYFGEGIAFLKDKVYQLTYKNQVGFMYNAKTFKPTGKFTFQNKEGWGLTTDSTYLIMSDGTNLLTYLSPKNMQVVKTLPISQNGYMVNFINELEYVNGYIYANIFTTNAIVKIDPSNGNIINTLDLSSLASDASNSFSGSAEMNGIAYNASKGTFYVTGKLWPKIYEIKLNN